MLINELHVGEQDLFVYHIRYYTTIQGDPKKTPTRKNDVSVYTNQKITRQGKFIIVNNTEEIYPPSDADPVSIIKHSAAQEK